MPGSPSSLPVVPSGHSPTSFVVDVDLAGLMARLGIDCGSADDQEAVFAAEQEALAASPEEPVEIPGRVAALLPTGAGLAAWLASASVGQCSDADLPDIALGYRRLAAWAQAQELSAVAEITSRTAIRRERADAAGHPDQVLPEAGAEVALALTMSQPTAMDWAGLATRLRWQLPATAAALTDGTIDLARTRIIAEATAPLSDETAHAVEERVLATAGEQTTGQLRAAVRRAVIAADPDGAERRREHAERCAKVSLYSDHDGTATLAGSGLPAVSAAAAMARITVIARAMKAAGFSGGLDYLRAYVMLGLLLGTVPPGPPPAGEPPGPPPGNPPPGKPPPGNPPPGHPQPGSPAADSPQTDIDDRFPPEADRSEPGGRYDAGEDAGGEDEPIDVTSPPVSWPPLPAGLPGPAGLLDRVGRPPPRSAPGRPPAGLLDVLLPWSALIGSPRAEPALVGRIGPVTPTQARQILDLAAQHPATEWRVILTDEDGRAQAVERLRRTSRSPSGWTRASPGAATPVIGRITVTIPPGGLATPDRTADSKLSAALLRAASRAAGHAASRAAAHAASRAAAHAGVGAHAGAADRAGTAGPADGGCDHQYATAAYRPAPRLREFVVARDGTCTFPPCGQPAWRADLDHTIPWHHGGPTCACNLSARCRTHHKIKQLPGWKLQQPQPGSLCWTTPAGRIYSVQPNRYPL